MKKVICLILSCLMAFMFIGCTNNETEQTTADSQATQAQAVSASQSSSKGESGVDVDLTALSSTMVYSEVYNMVTTPADYMGKTIKMDGAFSVYHDEQTGKDYFACIISDATACCQQGLEFVLDGDYTYPDDYPELGTEIAVTGVFDTYEENGQQYCQLINAKFA
ncbi:MAG: hypothetical protein ACI4GY_10770 [Acutalibacteraceae bacterium]